MTQVSQMISAKQNPEAMNARVYGKLESLLYFARQAWSNQHLNKRIPRAIRRG
jgi:hypothetical protein